MTRRPRTRLLLAQNLFRGPEPARKLTRCVAIGPGERVYDLGAGAGAVTAELVRLGARVVAVECDPNLARKLRERFAGAPVQVLEADLQDAAYAAPFKVVANPPFNLTADIVRRLLEEGPFPEEAALVLQREAAERYAGTRRPGVSSLTLAPWFELRIAGRFARSDFVPPPRVDTAVLHAARRSPPHLPEGERAAWTAFLRYAFARPSPDARVALKGLISNLQWRRLSADLAIAPEARRAALTYPQWLGLFRFVARCAPPHKLARIGPGADPAPFRRPGWRGRRAVHIS